MKNTFGNSVSLTLFGESHGAEIGAVLDGLAPGIPVDEDYIAGKLLLRFTGFGAMMRAWNILKKAAEFAKMYVKETGRNLFMVTGIEVIVKLLGGAINIAKSIRK